MKTELYEPRACKIEGWLYDLYPTTSGMILWFQRIQGNACRVVDERFKPSFYCRAPSSTYEEVLRALKPFRKWVQVRKTEQKEFFSNEHVSVLEIRLENPLLFPRAVSHITRSFREMEFYNCDISLEQLYLYESDLFPMCRARVKLKEKSDRVAGIEVKDDRWRKEYELPDLRVMELQLQGDRINPRHGKRGGLEVITGGQTRLLEGRNDREIIESLSSLLDQHDPDLLYTEWGDSYLIDRLQKRARESGIDLSFGRDPEAEMRRTGECNYESYGRVLYHGGSRVFRGRWHIDRCNSFILSESGLPGLIQLSRVSDMPVQILARRSPGTAISSMQLAKAGSCQYMIPWRKKKVERFKPASVLLDSDKGGLTYVPPVGFYEDVVELDFASMYPTIMAQFNISPETVLCEKCEGITVPETDYNVCCNRRGLVPAVLEEILEMRSEYKRRRDSCEDDEWQQVYDLRQTALKWILVTCFGYLGYKNARFGRIEAHEAVTAYSRDLLLRAKEIAEESGYRMLHALVDSLWLSRNRISRPGAQELARSISDELGIPLELEGVFRWICFVPSRSNPSIGVSNRYFGVFEDGKTKSRGIALRRRDKPKIVKETQSRMLSVLSEAGSEFEYRSLIPEALDVLAEAEHRVRDNRVEPEELAVNTRLSKDPREYKHNTMSACAAKQLLNSGVDLMPGETISYIITDRSSDIPRERATPLSLINGTFHYDIDEYVKHLRDAAWTLVQPFLENREEMNRS